MHPILFQFGSFTVYTYGAMIATGILCALLLARYRGSAQGFNRDEVMDVAFYGIIGGVLGAKLLYLITEASSIVKNPSAIKDMLTSGFVVYGAIIGGIAGVYLYCRSKRLQSKFLPYFDLLAPSLALAQGFGRIGCLMAGCCYGRETASPIGIVFRNSLYAPDGVRLYPTQLLSSGGDFVIAAVLLITASSEWGRQRQGRIAGLYMVLYSIGRFAIEFLRGDPRGNVLMLSTSQFICIFIFISGMLLLLKNKQHN